MAKQSERPPARRGRSAKEPLTQQSIVDAALGLIRERGVDAVSLRHVAEQVETGPASLYAYFGSRDILLEHVLDAAYSRVTLAMAGGTDHGVGWRDALSATIVNTIETLESYPGLGTVALGTIPVLPGALRLAEHELALMELGRVAPDRAALAVDLIAQYAASSAIERTVRSDNRRGNAERDHVRAAYETANADHFPHIRQSAALLTGPTEQARRVFAIQALIRGIESPDVS
ncbi:TetR/AcrR family transcriptional regulator [Propioniciclava flava]|uniref:TetR family transcriptional regulator n=1 Tax=Propioniciclava flava TaxID=2072026 RepID=A0A4V1Q724_9ACTN|nr:TetR family transcriptional regulator [Propioniciclava flava]RXW31098.1 TetR family transcriptional regulator [Propioniciclava flava]